MKNFRRKKRRKMKTLGGRKRKTESIDRKKKRMKEKNACMVGEIKCKMVNCRKRDTEKQEERRKNNRRKKKRQKKNLRRKSVKYRQNRTGGRGRTI